MQWKERWLLWRRLVDIETYHCHHYLTIWIARPNERKLVATKCFNVGRGCYCCYLDFKHAKMWIVYIIVKFQVQGGKIHSRLTHTISKWFIPWNSWWYWFKCKHQELWIHLAKGLESSRIQGLVSQSYSSFYQNL
jgi:hypothetical protein